MCLNQVESEILLFAAKILSTVCFSSSVFTTDMKMIQVRMGVVSEEMRV